MAAPAAAGLEGLAIFAGVRGAGPLAVALHLASCGCVALALRPRVVEGPAAWTLTLGISLFVPVFGALGLAALALSKSPSASSPEPDLVRTPIPGPAEIAAPPDAAPRVSVSRTSSRESRLAAVAAARGRNDPSSVALLRRVLEDADEDVRLLAHALLESKSRAAYRNVHERTRELDAASSARRAALHRRLALEHWEIAWLGLAQGECLDHVLGMARHHALAAIEGDPGRASLHLLLGRIALRCGEAQEAEAALLRAAELGLPGALVQPYLAEAAFLARRFDLVRRRLAEAGPLAGNAAGNRIRSYWS